MLNVYLIKIELVHFVSKTDEKTSPHPSFLPLQGRTTEHLKMSLWSSKTKFSFVTNVNTITVSGGSVTEPQDK